MLIIGVIIIALFNVDGVGGSDAMAQLYEDLLYHYINMVRPVAKPSDILTVEFGAYLIHLIDVDEKRQVITSNLWLEMEWFDKRLVWDPLRYDNVTSVHIPATDIWTPDIVLYNNADSKPQITIFTDVVVTYQGKVIWKPPAIYKSFCQVDVTYFPYDDQKCEMKFGTWSFDMEYVDLRFFNYTQEGHAGGEGKNETPRGMDLSYYYQSAEWDILAVDGWRNERIYSGCCGDSGYVDVTYTLYLRRRRLFYTANMILPSVMISVLTALVFYLPADTNEKTAFCVSLLVTLSVFFLLLVELMPATSLSVPLMAKYILFNMIVTGFGIFVTVLSLNLSYCNSSTRRMSRMQRLIFLDYLGPWLGVTLTKSQEAERNAAQGGVGLPMDSTLTLNINDQDWDEFETETTFCQPPIPQFTGESKEGSSKFPLPHRLETPIQVLLDEEKKLLRTVPKSQKNRPHSEGAGSCNKLLRYRNELQKIHGVLESVRYIADKYKIEDKDNRISEEWTHLAMVIDRLCLWLFSALSFFGTCIIILQAPLLHDTREAMEIPDPTRPLGYAIQH